MRNVNWDTQFCWAMKRGKEDIPKRRNHVKEDKEVREHACGTERPCKPGEEEYMAIFAF